MDAMRRALAPLRARVALMISRAVLALVDDAGPLQALQVELLADETRGDVERFQNYGFTSHPHPGAEAVAVCVAGSRDHVLVLAVDDRRYRLASLAQGEVALYTDEGDRIVLKRGGVVQVHAATKLEVVAPLVTMSGDLQVSGDVTAGAVSLKAHRHGGVQNGGGQTGVAL